VQEQKREAELQQQMHQQRQQQLEQALTESKALAEGLSSKLVQMDRDACQFEAHIARQSSALESERQSVAHLQSHVHVVEKSLGEARASLSSMHTENARLNAELLLSQEALDASHARERQLIVQLETNRNNGIAETAARAVVAAEQYRLSQVQVESLQKHVSEVQSQLREARRTADTASAAEREALSLLAASNSEILKLRLHVRELDDAAKETGDRMRAVQNEADTTRQQLLDLVRLCKQQERAHAILKESVQVGRPPEAPVLFAHAASVPHSMMRCGKACCRQLRRPSHCFPRHPQVCHVSSIEPMFMMRAVFCVQASTLRSRAL
jgi:chromosome segregation ATPase